MYLEPHSFDAHVSHEHRLIVRYVARTSPVKKPFVIDLTESVSRVVMCKVRKLNAQLSLEYWTCRCLDGYTSTEFAYACEEDASIVSDLIDQILGTFNLVNYGGGVDLSIMARLDTEGQPCECPYSYGKRGGDE